MGGDAGLEVQFGEARFVVYSSAKPRVFVPHARTMLPDCKTELSKGGIVLTPTVPELSLVPPEL